MHAVTRVEAVPFRDFLSTPGIGAQTEVASTAEWRTVQARGRCWLTPRNHSRMILDEKPGRLIRTGLGMATARACIETCHGNPHANKPRETRRLAQRQLLLWSGSLRNAHRPLRQAAEGIPGELEGAVNRCLRTDLHGDSRERQTQQRYSAPCPESNLATRWIRFRTATHCAVWSRRSKRRIRFRSLPIIRTKSQVRQSRGMTAMGGSFSGSKRNFSRLLAQPHGYTS